MDAALIQSVAAIESKIDTLDRIMVVKAERLGRWAHLLQLQAASVDDFVHANKHFAGFAPETIRQRKVAIEGSGPAGENPKPL